MHFSHELHKSYLYREGQVFLSELFPKQLESFPP
jgi:hypothetical protein